MYRSSFIILILFFLFLSLIFPSFFSEFKFLIPYLLGVVMFGMGMTLSFYEIREILKKPSWIFLTTFLQFSIMPLLAILLVKCFSFSDEVALGFIILGACPGGTASNVIAFICKANVSLSIMCTFVSTSLSVLFTPLLIYLMADHEINIKLLSLVKSTFFIVFLPVLLGLMIKIFFKKNQKNFLQLLPFLSEVVIAFIIAIIFAVNSESLVSVSSKMILAVILHNIIGLYIALSIARFFKCPEGIKKAIAIEVAMQNSGLGMTLAMLHFSKLVALPSALFSLWHNISAAGLVYLWKKK